MALSARGVGVVLGGAPILRDVDLDVRTGEVLALVGPNGAGKSTLLSVLSGDTVPTTGSVDLGGTPLARHSARDLARERAVLLQKQGLSFGFRAHEVVRMGRTPWHRTTRADDDDVVVDAAMESGDVTHLAERLFPTLSGGEQARTSFARLLAQEAPVMLLDEPTAALDIKHQEQLLEVARTSARAGAAVVVVLHDLSLAAAHADRVCVLSHGHVRACGPPADVLTGPLLSEVYQHPVDVIAHDHQLLVVPVRSPRLPVPQERP
ncbi:heme ABC transporter ATP-binding protein [Nocardioides pacificus]